MDPFFVARAKMKGLGVGANSYLEDINRTYGKLPKRDGARFEKAMQFREKEKKQIEAIASENENLRKSLAHYETLETSMRKELMRYGSLTGRAASLLKSQSATINSLKSKVNLDGTATSSSNGSIGFDGVSSIQKSVDATDGVQSEVLPPNLPNPRGQPEEHTIARRSSEGGRISEEPTGGRVQFSEPHVP